MNGGVEDEQIELSSESEPEDIDLDIISDIRVDADDLNQLDQLMATTKNKLCMCNTTQNKSQWPKADHRATPSTSSSAISSSSTK